MLDQRIELHCILLDPSTLLKTLEVLFLVQHPCLHKVWLTPLAGCLRERWSRHHLQRFFGRVSQKVVELGFRWLESLPYELLLLEVSKADFDSLPIFTWLKPVEVRGLESLIATSIEACDLKYVLYRRYVDSLKLGDCWRWGNLFKFRRWRC